jgi:hypothetical protein
MKKNDINVIVEYTEGCEKRYTEAVLRVLEKRKKRNAAEMSVYGSADHSNDNYFEP